MSMSRDEVHRLVDALPDDRLAAIGEALRAAVLAETSDESQHLVEQPQKRIVAPRLATEPLRTFLSAGTLSGADSTAHGRPGYHRPAGVIDPLTAVVPEFHLRGRASGSRPSPAPSFPVRH